MQSCRVFVFFFSHSFMKISNFPKNGPYFFPKLLHSHSTPKDAPACANAIKSYGWDVRNIAKINPKMAKNSHFSPSLIFVKTVHTIRTKFSTDSSKSFDWDSSESEGKRPELTPLPHMRLW